MEAQPATIAAAAKHRTDVEISRLDPIFMFVPFLVDCFAIIPSKNRDNAMKTK
jgi:hypothetical protein